MLEGLPEHRNTVEEFRLVSRQLEAAKAEQKDALLIAELEDELKTVYTKLVIAAEGALLPAPLHDILPQ